MKIARLLLAIIAIMLIAYGVLYESHTIRNLINKDQSEVIRGDKYIEGTTNDSYINRHKKLYNVYSIESDSDAIKDCKT